MYILLLYNEYYILSTIYKLYSSVFDDLRIIEKLKTYWEYIFILICTENVKIYEIKRLLK